MRGREEASVGNHGARIGGFSGRELFGGLAKIVVVGAAYYVAARLSLQLALVAENVTPLWPPTGIALVAFLILGRGIWPGVVLAAFLVNEPISTSPLAAAATAAGNTLAPFVAAELLTRVGFHREIDRTRDAIAIVFLGALGGTLISASVGAATLVASGAIAGREFPSAWAVWWTGDAMGILVVAPFLFSLLPLRGRPAWSWRRWLEAGTVFVLLTAVSLAVVQTELSLLFLILPLLGWTAWRFQQRGSAPAALLVAGLATWAAAHDLGPFEHEALFQKMLTLQGFNATVALSSFFFAAMVTERARVREALEQGAAELEARVERRTSDLSEANERLRHEVADRKRAERALRYRGRQLADAQQLAHLGSWEWRIPENQVTWSEEMYRIYGYRPKEFTLTFEKAVERVVPADLERIQENTASSLRVGKNHDLPPMEYRIVRPDGVERVLRGKARLQVDHDRKPVRMVGTVQDVTESKRAEREHRIAETLQRNLLPDRLPDIPGVTLSARYVPATTEVAVGGDWYDVVQLPDGRVGVAIGDVAGHGLRAAASMGQLRMALRAYALEDGSPARVLTRVHNLIQRLPLAEMTTLVYLVFDQEERVMTFANAGHPPPLLVPAEGPPRYLEDALAPPVGGTSRPGYVESTVELGDGSTLFLFTDGLVERRGVSLRDGLGRLSDIVATDGADLERLCDRVIGELVGTEVSDDVALLAVRPVGLGTRSVTFRVPAAPHVLAPLRHTLRRWLRGIDAGDQDVFDILVACGEACANAIQHPYGAREGAFDLDLALEDGEVQITVRDVGSWRVDSGADGGRGVLLMRGLMDSVDIQTGPEGTVVRMRRRLRMIEAR